MRIPVARGLLAATALCPAAWAALAKPAISPAFDLDGAMETQLRKVLPMHQWGATTWAAGWVPLACQIEATENGLSAADLVVYNVSYSDCKDPWVICRHRRSPTAVAEIFNRFGQIPVGMRQHLQNLVALPTSTRNVAYTRGSWTVIFGDWFHIGTMAHEFTHVLDLLALEKFVSRPGSQPFSDTSYWQAPQAADTALPTSYSAASWQEDFAESGRVAMTDMVVSGGLAGINPSASKIRYQVSTYESFLRHTIFTTTGRCTAKTASTVPVRVATRKSVKVRAAAASQKPNVTLSGQVPEIVVPEAVNRWKFVYPLPQAAGNMTRRADGRCRYRGSWGGWGEA